MIGRHCIKTWATTQGAVALSSAEAEFYAMIEATIRAKGLLTKYNGRNGIPGERSNKIVYR